MNNGNKFHGVVVPMITPLTAAGGIDETAMDRLIDSLLGGGVDGIFVLGTTGEGAFVPREARSRLVRRAAARVNHRALVYAGMGDIQAGDGCLAKEFFQAGADALVAHPPITTPVPGGDLAGWFQSLLDRADGPVILYNMPSTTRVSIPFDALAKLMGHPRLMGIKDSENNAARHAELLKLFAGRPGFSVFVGVGALMAQGLRSGASGVVPSVGNLIPETCHALYLAARAGNWEEADARFARMNAVAAVYQKGRTLDQSLSALKAAASCRGLCAPHVLPPLQAVSVSELETIRLDLHRLQLLN